jgi:hypothetical protein
MIDNSPFTADRARAYPEHTRKQLWIMVTRGEYMANIARRSFLAFPSELSSTSPDFAPLAVAALQVFPEGLRRGAITEVVGRRSSGLMATSLHVLAQATAQGEICAVIDTNDQFHPASAYAAGVNLTYLIWVRCGKNTEHALRAADLLLHAGGFGLVVLDLCDVKPRVLNRIPISYWYRFRRAIENTPTILLVCSPSPQAKASGAQVELTMQRAYWKGSRPFRLLREVETTAQVRKPVTRQASLLSVQNIA